MGTSDPAEIRALAMQRAIDTRLAVILESLPEVPSEPQPEYFI